MIALDSSVLFFTSHHFLLPWYSDSHGQQTASQLQLPRRSINNLPRMREWDHHDSHAQLVLVPSQHSCWRRHLSSWHHGNLYCWGITVFLCQGCLQGIFSPRVVRDVWSNRLPLYSSLVVRVFDHEFHLVVWSSSCFGVRLVNLEPSVSWSEEQLNRDMCWN